MQALEFPIYRETYLSQLGSFELLISSSNQLFNVEITAASLRSAGHDIVLRRMNPVADWLPGHMSVETTTAWQFYLTKRNSSQEQLTISMQLWSGASIIADPTSGEHLIAVEFENGSRQIHLGTEDEDAMAGRASEDDWLPRRLELALRRYDLEITSAVADGLQTVIPQLEPGDQFYFHYILAENPLRPSADYPAESDISTWFAVERSKSELERAWQEHPKKART